jgi:hypothetical protein
VTRDLFANGLRTKSDKPIISPPPVPPATWMPSYTASQRLSLPLLSHPNHRLVLHPRDLSPFRLNVKEVFNTTRCRPSGRLHGCRAHINEAQCGESSAPGNSHHCPCLYRSTDVGILWSYRISLFYDYLTSLRGETSNLFNDLSSGKENMSFPHSKRPPMSPCRMVRPRIKL